MSIEISENYVHRSDFVFNNYILLMVIVRIFAV